VCVALFLTQYSVRRGTDMHVEVKLQSNGYIRYVFEPFT